MANVVTASYETRAEAEDAAERLVAAGLTRQEISMLASEDAGGAVSFSIEPRKRTLAGLGGGALLGLVVGALCGAVLALGPFAIAGLDQLGLDFERMEPIVAALVGAGVGSAAGALLGALVGVSRTEHEAVLRNGDKVGNISYVLVGVSVPPEMKRSAVRLLSHAGAHKIVRG